MAEGLVTFEEVVTGLLDYADRFTADGSGNVEENLNVRIPPETLLYLDRIVIRSGSTAFNTFALFADDSDQAHTREWTDVGPNNVADEASPVRFTAPEQLVARWLGLDAGATATIVLQGRFVKQVVRMVPAYATVAFTVPATADDVRAAIAGELAGADPY